MVSLPSRIMSTEQQRQVQQIAEVERDSPGVAQRPIQVAEISLK